MHFIGFVGESRKGWAQYEQSSIKEPTDSQLGIQLGFLGPSLVRLSLNLLYGLIRLEQYTVPHQVFTRSPAPRRSLSSQRSSQKTSGSYNWGPSLLPRSWSTSHGEQIMEGRVQAENFLHYYAKLGKICDVGILGHRLPPHHPRCLPSHLLRENEKGRDIMETDYPFVGALCICLSLLFTFFR